MRRSTGARAFLSVVALSLLTHGCRSDSERSGLPAERVQQRIDADLRDELLSMAEDDQRDRASLIALAAAQDTAALKRISQADSIRSARLREIVDAHGWPGLSLVGEEAASAAFLLIQHSPSSAFQKQVLPLLTAAAFAGEASKEQLALLTDRVLVRDGKPQRYGTQAYISDGKVILEPIEDEAHVDARRAELGMIPLAEYVAQLERLYLRPVDEDARR